MTDHRLPPGVVPRSYHLELAPDLERATFAGTVGIQVDVEQPTSTIVLNAAELTIKGASLIDSRDTEHQVEWSTDEQLERLTLTTTVEVATGPARLELDFDGALNDKLRGFYRSTFVDDQGVTRTVATTQFESTDARRAFPCWDEPDLKATFDVTLVVPSDLLAISSGPEVERTEAVGKSRIRFGTTMRMSTYVLAFVVGPLEATEAVDVNGIPLRIVHPLGKGHLTEFAARVGEFSLRHFADYFDIAYPGEKLDLVALPDFAFGAMENLGCITFREALLLLDEDSSTQPEQQQAADVIAHEVAHMWFGNLVTMRWWNGIWLKEAFATFCEMHATNAMRPDWLRWDDFNSSRTAAFGVDALTATRPIEFEVVSPADAEAMYDILTYEKGAAIVRMLEQFLGEEEFREGIRHYLRKHAYSNTEATDLWDAIEEATGQPARQIMDSWILQGGYPLVTIERLSPTSVRLRQERFVYSDETNGAQWSVPVVLGVAANGERHRHSVLLDQPQVDVDLGPEPFDWIVGNAEASGFYRVHNEAAPEVPQNLDVLSGVERYGRIDDTWAALLAGRVGIREVLGLVADVAGSETDTAVWRRIIGVLREVDHHLEGTALETHRQGSMAILSDGLDRVGRDPQAGDSDTVRELWATLFETLGVFGDQDQIRRARTLLQVSGKPALTAAAIRIVASVGGAEDFKEFAAAYESASDPQEERRYLLALPDFRGADELERLLEMLDTDRIRSQDSATVLGRALSNNSSAPRVWEFIEANWDSICSKYPENSIARLIAGAQNVGDPAVADAIDAFFANQKVPQLGQRLYQYLERMRISVALRRRLRSELV